MNKKINITDEKIVKQEIKQKIVICELLNKRQEPNMNAQILSVLKKNDKVIVIDEFDGWSKLNDNSFVKSEFIK